MEMTKLSAEERLRRRREELGLSRREVAEMAGVPVSRIWASEQTKVGVSDEDRKKIADALNERVASIAKLQPIT